MRIGSLGLAELKALIRVAKSGGSGMAIAAAADKQMVLRATGVAESTPVGHAWPQAAALLTVEAACEGDQHEWLRHLARRYRLTPMEQVVLRRIGMGETVDAIAVELGVLPSTVRTHLNALFDKTGRRRQSQLLRLALGR
ncbi:MAG TPA: helix-turn-helix transcriptional regulator [Burkholderiaceae bacterium]|nr:helix-turn-helix transcriptional regulator [Burkholderiaceae bacterium]